MSHEPPVDSGVVASGQSLDIAAVMAAIKQEIVGPAMATADADERPADPAASVAVPATPAPVPVAATGAAGIDAEVRALLAPLLRDWLAAHLPEIVEAAVHAELRRLTGLN